MTMLAHFDEERSGDRRGAARRTLRLSLRGAEQTGRQIVIHDLSVSGMLLETAAPLAIGETFHLQLPEAGATEATVVWNSGNFYGCQFAAPIPQAAVSAALLQSPFPTAPDEAPAEVRAAAELRQLTSRAEKVAGRLEKAITELLRRDE